MQRRNSDMPIMATMSDKRMLSVPEFCVYASIGRDRGMELAKAAGAIFRVGKRVNIDRVKFDRWCDENSELEL